MDGTKHVGVIAIIISKRETTAPKVNQILTSHGDLIIGRLGLPYGDHGLHVISLIVDGEKERLQDLAAELTAVPDTIVESTMSPVCLG
jgi:putative iron-only hydrogenase system regulator